MSVRIEILADIRDIQDRMPQWRELHRQVGQSPFSSAEWIMAWFDAWPEPKAQPAFGFAWQGERLVAGWPLGLSMRKTSKIGPRTPTLHPLCHEKSGYHEMLMADGYESIVVEMIEAYRTNLHWNVMDLYPMKQSPTCATILNVVRNGAFKARARHEIRTVHADMPDGWDAYLADRSRDFRKSLRSSERKLAGLDHSYSSSFGLDDIEEERLDEAIELSGRCWKAHLGTDLETDPALRNFTKALFRRMVPVKMVSLNLLKIEGVAAAAVICMYWNRNVFGVVSDFDERFSQLSPGRLVIARAMQQAATKGFKEVEFLRATPFTRRFATRESAYLRVRIARKIGLTNVWLGVEELLRPIGQTARKNKQLLQRKRAGSKDLASLGTPKGDAQND